MTQAAIASRADRDLRGELIVPHGSIAEKQSSLRRVESPPQHTDHTTGAGALCRAHDKPIPLFQNRLQVEESNYTTRPGLEQLANATCLKPEIVDDGPLHRVRGFPGLSFFAAAGHTPGSQIFVAHVRSSDGVRTYALTGDVVNQIDGVRRNIAKPTLYSLVVVPESTARLDKLRRFLAELERDHGARSRLARSALARGERRSRRIAR
jgi:hypothetical protein